MTRQELQRLLEVRMRENPKLREAMRNPYFAQQMQSYLDQLAQPLSGWNLAPDDGTQDLAELLFQTKLDIPGEFDDPVKE